MTKVVGIEKGKKPAPGCQFCGKTPACPGWTCPRIASVTVDSDGWQVEFVTTFEVQFVPQDVTGEEPAP